METTLDTITRTFNRRPLLTASLATLGTLWLTSKLSSIAAFTYLHFLRPSSLKRYQIRASNDSPSSTSSAWALVTGSSDGIGRGFAEDLCSRGFNIILHGRNEDKLQSVRRDLLQQWPDRQIKIFVFDATGESTDLEDAVKEQLSGLKITILINNVAAAPRPLWMPLSQSTSQRIGLSIGVDARFTVEITRLLLPILIKQSPALVLNIGSLSSEAPCPYVSVLSGTKAFGKAWSRSLNLETKAEGHDVEVIHILVGMVATPNENRTPSLTVPTPHAMARSSLDKVGCGKDVVVGYWAHSLMSFVMLELPALVWERMVLSIVKKERENEAGALKG